MLDTPTSSKALDGAVQALGSLPGIGAKTALRLALHLLRQPKEKVLAFGQAISALANDTRYCRLCGAPCENDLCEVCANPRRNSFQICVVENIRDRLSVENTASFKGVYHLLGGLISPVDGIGPSDLRIDELTERIQSLKQQNPDTPVEVILALSGGAEGETTAFYLYRKLEPLQVCITTLARGLAYGQDIEYADPVTLGQSITRRVPFHI